VQPASPPTPQIKQDILTLRYKPQAGTLLYDIRTEVDQRVRTDRDELSGSLVSTAQLAFHNVAVDYKKGLWSFDQYFISFLLAGRQLTGDSLQLRENGAVNKITRLTYDMKGHELSKQIVDSLTLLNTEAQANSYFLQPPRLLIPLPERSVTYGNTWSDHRIDTVTVRDTVNIGTTSGEYTYDVYRTYKLDRLLDTLQSYLAVITATDSGSFVGSQNNSVTKVSIKIKGPISGADTTYLDLFSGRVLLRTLRMAIPAIVEVSTASTSSNEATTPFTDFEEVRSVTVLDESNAMQLKGN
jgi:hypothetical protein